MSTVDHFVSESCVGELCGMCYRESGQTNNASHKVGEEIPFDHPAKRGHNATQYVCCKHFASIISPETARKWTGCQV